MRFNMVSYRYRSRLLSDFSAILFQLFSVTSGFSLSLSTDTNHIETHYRISVLSLGKFTIYCNGLTFYSPADSLGIFQIMCFNMVQHHIEIHSGNRTQRIEISILHPAGQWPLSLNVFQYGARGGTRTRMAITAGGF